jgi:hypothetical protein
VAKDSVRLVRVYMSLCCVYVCCYVACTTRTMRVYTIPSLSRVAVCKAHSCLSLFLSHGSHMHDAVAVITGKSSKSKTIMSRAVKKINRLK